MMRASAAELDAIELHLVAGAIPADLSGHLFLIAPVGSVQSNGLPNPDDSHVWNGNGLIHRFDLQPGGPIRLTTRLARTPCYWADLATRPGTAKARMGFSDWGMARFSIRLGMRNQLNTAFVPMRFAAGEATRLLLTFDGGRPYEIDPVSLAVVTPMGGNDEWRPGAKLPLPFPPVLSTAHPVFDPATATVFTVNYGRSTANLLATIPLLSRLSWVARAVVRLIWPLSLLAHLVFKPLLSWLDRETGAEDFVHLLGWDGQGPLRRWRLVDGQGRPLRIQQTMHQIGVSQDYVVLADTSLKFGMEQLLPGPLSLCPALNRLLRRLLTKPQRADTRVFIVRKADLTPGRDTVPVRSLTLPLETGHFLVDAENPGGRITLHAGHEPATDVSEWVRPEDVSASDAKPLDPRLQGMISVGAMDVGRLGRYVIDGETGRLLESQLLHDERYTWGIGLYACRQNGQDGTAHEGRLSSVYWQSLGFWPDLLSKFIYRLYANYPHRLVPLNQLLGGPKTPGSRPSTLFRVDTTTMTMADAYPFPQERLADGTWQTWICNSPQFIPRGTPPSSGPSASATGSGTASTSASAPASTSASMAVDPATQGWIVCLAISEQSKEVWIFDAANLAAGPLCRLSHPRFDPGYTIHSTWLQTIQPRTAPYGIDARADYDPLLRKAARSVRALFNQEVYPRLSPR